MSMSEFRKASRLHPWEDVFSEPLFLSWRQPTHETLNKALRRRSRPRSPRRAASGPPHGRPARRQSRSQLGVVVGEPGEQHDGAPALCAPQLASMPGGSGPSSSAY
jgi:hypothetical protein